MDPIEALFNLLFPELMYRAQTVHRENFDPTRVEFATLLSIKTGGCPEDCSHCLQAARLDTGVAASKLMKPAEVLPAAQRTKDAGATRFCMGAAWRSPKDRDIEKVVELVHFVKALGLETCAGTSGRPRPVRPFEFVRTIAVARITMPTAHARLSTGRQQTGRWSAGAVFSGRCQFHFLWRQAADHRQPRHRS